MLPPAPMFGLQSVAPAPSLDYLKEPPAKEQSGGCRELPCVVTGGLLLVVSLVLTTPTAALFGSDRLCLTFPLPVMSSV